MAKLGAQEAMVVQGAQEAMAGGLSWHDEESGALTGSLSNRLHFRDKGAGGWKWPPRPLQEEPPAPDESPWTRPKRYIKTVPEGKTRLKNHDSGDMAWHSWP